MKEQLYTIPLNDAMSANDECPFCFIERSVEQDMLDFVLGSGSSYMESHVRSQTDQIGFCRNHFKKMFDYGNTLGNGWILKSHYQTMIGEMKSQFKAFSPTKSTLKSKFIKATTRQNPIGIWAEETTKSCYVCKGFQDTYERYLDTFFVMYRNDSLFREKVAKSKGFCLPHFGDLCEAADTRLNDKEKIEFYPIMFHLMEENMNRLSQDVSWLVDKFDYRNKDADWKTSKDAIQRGMQKLKGGYPGDGPYKMSK
jgi:hypothetical protein